MEYTVVGKSVPKVDSITKVKGQAVYAADALLPGMLWAKVLRSPYPHAKILNIDTSKAKGLTGVKAVITAKDVPSTKWGVFVEDQTIFAIDKVHFIGEAVAAVAAMDEDIAEEALDLIEVEYEELPAVFDPFEAMQPGAPLIHEGRENNIALSKSWHFGDVDKAFAEADYVFEDRFVTGRQAHAPLESHLAVANWDGSGKLHLWSSTQSPYLTRFDLLKVLGIPFAKIRIYETHVGGAFGAKIEGLDIDMIAPLLAKAAGKPVKLVNNRAEEFTVGLYSHAWTIDMKSAVRKDGRVIARDAKVVVDNGGYSSHGPGEMYYTGKMLGQHYNIPNTRWESYAVYTNKPSGGAFRGYGDPMRTFAEESQMDIIAGKLGMDPLELRLKNAAQPGDVTAGGLIFNTCGIAECLSKAAEAIGWKEKKANKQPNRGLGIACGIHVSGARYHPAFDGDFSEAEVRVNEDGSVTLLHGGSDLGQGSDTIMSQIVAEELGVPIESISVVSGDSDLSVLCMGSLGSRQATIMGNAVRNAALEAKQKLCEVAAGVLEASVEDMEVKDGKVFVRGTPDKALPTGTVVLISIYRNGGQWVHGRAHYDSPSVQPNPETGYGSWASSYPFFANAAEVEVDPETGQVKILDFVAAHDVGKALNPSIVEGQIQGGVVQGLGYALMEDLVFDNGKLLNPSFTDYKLFTTAEVPFVRPIIVETIDPNGAYGAKGLGETPRIASSPALANAIREATGVRLTNLPMTPERVFWAMREKEG